MSELTGEKDAPTGFTDVVAGLCSHGCLVWEVTYRDGTTSRLHQGLWPYWLNDAQRSQLRDTRVPPPGEGDANA